jgi:hypothetical protein
MKSTSKRLNAVRAVFLGTILLPLSSALAQQVTLINMIPNSLSGETNRDAEPNLAVNPANPNQIVASAFTPDPMGSSSLPLFISTNGGAAWTLTAPLITGTTGACFTAICDITVRFGGSSNLLYVSDLNPLAAATRLDIWKVTNPTTAGAITVLQQRSDASGYPDQPYIAAATVIGGSGTGKDRLFVADNDYLNPSGKTATIDHTPDATPPAPSGFSKTVLETRATSGQDSPSVRPAVHPDGTVYGVYAAYRATGTEVVVVRDDSWGTGATPFQALIDADLQPGIRVVSMLTGTSAVGSQRAGTGLAIAVDPNNSQNVYIVYGEGSTSATYTLHVLNSTTGGSTWSGTFSVASATNPGIAVTSAGEVGFLYQKSNSGSFETHLIRTSNNFSTTSDILLANVPDLSGSYGGSNPIGDYACLLAVGKDFYGVFSAYNTPDPANFYSGVVFQRNHDFATHTLTDLASNPVAASIDPFFFHVSDVTPSTDFYVRDWSDSPTVHDLGQEPSTNPVFYLNSDVWNRRENIAGGFDAGTDRPNHEDPQDAIVGPNFAFVRVNRNAPATGGSPDAAVTAAFLYADYGLGTSYVAAAASPAPTLTFAAADTEKDLTDGNGYQWNLPVTHSTHVCMGMEISAPGDSFNGDLLGHAPGWPTTDLMVINDNNKAQRNMGIWVPPMTDQSDTLTYYAQIHNAATFPRDMVLRYDIAPVTARRLQVKGIEIIGTPAREGNGPQKQAVVVPKSGGTITLSAMQPGENRWLGITLSVVAGKEGEILTANLTETGGNLRMNGIAVGVRPAPLATSISETLAFEAAVFARIAALFGSSDAKALAESSRILRQEGAPNPAYLALVNDHLPRIDKETASLLKNGDPFGVKPALLRMQGVLPKADPFAIVVAHAALLEKLDATVSMLDKAKGDTADILQNVSLQVDVYRKAASLKPFAPKIIDASAQYIRGFSSFKNRDDEFRSLIANLSAAYSDTAKQAKDKSLDSALAAMKSSPDAQTLQGSHRQFLLRLQQVSK